MNKKARKIRPSGALILFSIFLVFYSCTRKEIEYFDLNMVFYGPLDQSQYKENGKLPAEYSSLMNYYDDTVSHSKIYVPVVKIERGDFSPPKQLLYEFPLSGVNRFRNSLDMLSAPNLIGDYDKNISKLIIPGILVESNTSESKVNFSPSDKGVENSLNVNLISYNLESSRLVINAIKELLNDGSVNGDIRINFYMEKKIIFEDTTGSSLDTTNLAEPCEGPSEGTKTYPNGDVYVGEQLNCLPEGWGKMTYKEARRFPQFEIYKHEVDAGDYLEGIWKGGEFSSGKRYDKNGKFIETWIRGGE